MKSYTKYRNIPTQLVVITFFALLVQYRIQVESYVGYLIIWMVLAIFMIIYDYTTYRIGISNREIIIKKLFRKEKTLSFNRITRIRFEGYLIRGRWLLMSVYDQDIFLVSAEISSLCCKNFVQNIINNAAMNGITIDVDNDAKKFLQMILND